MAAPPHPALDFSTAPATVAGAAAALYPVFLSYSHSDTKWARWLMRRLERYRVPRRFHGRPAPIGCVGPRIAPVFRDREELPTTSDLGETIRQALRQSATLVVICSPRAARSRWVHEEIMAFKRVHGERSVFAFIVDGEPNAAGAADDCFPPALRAGVGADGELGSTPAEVVAADARPKGDGPKLAFVRLVAGLLGVGFDDLRRRELQRRNRRLTLIALSSAFGMALTLGLAVIAWQARNDARRRQDQSEDLLAFILGDIRTQLQKVGRLDILEEVGTKSMAYFASLQPQDLTDTTLARQAKALTQIGETRMVQGRYPEAARAFVTAYQRASALTERHPRDPAMYFERAQAEYWIGYVHRRQGQFDAAQEWLTRYRDSAVAMVRMEPANQKWRTELSSSWHNLAVLRVDAGDLDAARAAFIGKLEALRVMSAANPTNLELKYRITDTESWLGSVAERSGDFSAALARFSSESEGLATIARAEPHTMRWRFERADSLSFQATILSITGRIAEARTMMAEVRKVIGELVAHDGANREWAIVLQRARLKEAALQSATGVTPAVAQEVGHARQALEGIAVAVSSSRMARPHLAMAFRMEAEFVDQTRGAGAVEAAARAIELGESLVGAGTPTEGAIGECARAYLAAAAIAERRGDRERCVAHASRAFALLAARIDRSKDWRVLDPAARALALLGRSDESHALIARLDRFGYSPIVPWPDTPLTSVHHP